MDKVKKNRLTFKRRLVQLYCALLYNAQVKGFVSGRIYTGRTKYACVPGLNCYSCPGAVGACPLGALQNALANSEKRVGFYVIGILLLYGIMLGRTICGWLCPMGMIQELLHLIPTPKLGKSRVTRALSYLKYGILAVFAVAIPVWYGVSKGIPVPGFCKYICPAGTSEGAMLLLPGNPDFFSMLGELFTRKFVIMVVIALACVFCYRSFCRFICPLGAIYGLFNSLAVVGVKVDSARCTGCGACVRHCGMDVKRVGDHECISCGKCMDVCGTKAIAIKAGNFTLAAPDGFDESEKPEESEKRRRVVRVVGGIAVSVLIFALVWFNFLDPHVKSAHTAPSATTEKTDQPAQDVEPLPEPQDEIGPYHSDAPVGFEEGERLAEFSAECIDGSTFRLSDCRGKVTIINLWATYCGPCVQELPFFVELYHAHEDDIAMLAIHAPEPVEDVGEYLAERGWDIPFAVDSDEGELFAIVNGSEALPQTIVLNRRGEVIYNRVGSVSAELLKELYEQAAG